MSVTVRMPAIKYTDTLTSSELAFSCPLEAASRAPGAPVSHAASVTVRTLVPCNNTLAHLANPVVIEHTSVYIWARPFHRIFTQFFYVVWFQDILVFEVAFAAQLAVCEVVEVTGRRFFYVMWRISTGARVRHEELTSV